MFFGPVLSWALANNDVAAHVSSHFFKLSLKSRSKPNEFPKLLPQQLKVRRRSTVSGSVHCTAEFVTVWEDETCFSLALLFPKPSKAVLHSGRQKGGETVEKLNK